MYHKTIQSGFQELQHLNAELISRQVYDKIPFNKMSVQFLESNCLLFHNSFSLYIRTIIKSITEINKQTTIFIAGWTYEVWWTFVGNVYSEN